MNIMMKNVIAKSARDTSIPGMNAYTLTGPDTKYTIARIVEAFV
jgi:hypothetical protein